MLIVRALSRSFREGERRHRVLDGLDADVAAGEVVAVVGRSGSGKSTLLNLICGIDRPDSGTIEIGGESITALAERQRTLFRRRHLGFVYQFFNLVPMLDVIENIALPLLLDGRRLSDALPRVNALMERLGIADRADHEVTKLSGGEMQRVAIARALVGNPGLVLADEPTGNLDDRNGGEVLDLLSSLCRENGITVVMMTHDAGATERADRVVTLRDGEVEQDLTMKPANGA